MSDKKHIDKLFKEKLTNFEASPNASVWDGIASKLSEGQQDRKAIPLWWKIAGIAAGILLLVSLGNVIFSSEEEIPQQNEVVDTESDKNTAPAKTNASDDLQITGQDNLISDAEDKVADESPESVVSSNSDTENSSDNEPVNANNPNRNAVVIDNSPPNKDNDGLNRKDKIINQKDAQSGIAENKKAVDNQDDLNNPLINKQKTDELINDVKDPLDDAVVKTDDGLKTDPKAEETTDAAEELSESEDVQNEDEAKESLIEAVASDEDPTEEQPLEEDEPEEIKSRWGVAPNIAPVYFNAFGSGSAIDGQFKNNSRSGEINLSYGIVASYDFNDKLSLRAGVNKMELGYNTNGVIVYNNIEPSVEEKPLKYVDLNQTGQHLSFLSANGLGFGQVPGVVADNIQSSIDQRLGFIEVPLELEYKISDKKLGVNLIGGISTLFLNQNEIYSTLQGERTLLGEATNINKTSFSANLGLGLDYKISKQFNLNLEPVFKYQLNTFKDTDGNFNPYFIGVYTGLKFKF